MSRKPLYWGCFLVHFFFIIVVCCRDVVSLVGQGYTFLPASFRDYWPSADEILSAGLGKNLPLSNPVRQIIGAYTHFTGIESGYSFFAPNVPDSYKLVFEIHYPDGRIEYELPHVASGGGGLRLSTLLDNIGETRYAALREMMVKMIAYSILREHPDATMVRAVLGFVILPTAAEFRKGGSESYEFLYAYDFRLPSSPDYQNR